MALHLPTLSSLPKVRSALVSLAILAVLVACGGSGKAPDFSLTQFNGDEFSLSELEGHSSAVINFWFPTCPPCREEMPAFESAWMRLQEEGRAVKFLGILTAGRSDD